MRRTVISCLLFMGFLATLPAQAGVNIWTPIGPDGGRIEDVAVHPRNGQVVYAATRGGVYKSTDGAATWRWSGRGLQSNGARDLAIAPSNPLVIYAATNGGVFVSRDGGETWRAPERRFQFLIALSVAVDPRNARHAWAGSSNGLFETRDLGATWTLAEVELTASALDVAVDPVHPDTLYVLSQAHEDGGETGILKSTDGGATWQIRNDGLDALFLVEERARLAIDPENPSILYAAFYNEYATRELAAFRSADGGANWQQIPAGYPVTAGSNGVVYAGGFRSADHGQTWQPIAQPPAWESPAQVPR